MSTYNKGFLSFMVESFDKKPLQSMFVVGLISCCIIVFCNVMMNGVFDIEYKEIKPREWFIQKSRSYQALNEALHVTKREMDSCIAVGDIKEANTKKDSFLFVAAQRAKCAVEYNQEISYVNEEDILKSGLQNILDPDFKIPEIPKR